MASRSSAPRYPQITSETETGKVPKSRSDVIYGRCLARCSLYLQHEETASRGWRGTNRKKTARRVVRAEKLTDCALVISP